MLTLGLDTSNYTTSAAVYNTESGEIIRSKLFLPVKSGELGLRQNDAVFWHTKQLPDVMKKLSDACGGGKGESGFGFIPDAIGVSVRPRNADDSYMPCFLCGEGLADSLSAVCGAPVYKTSHQVGHILAALYSAGRSDLVHSSFIAFHVSGGTTDCLLAAPDKENILSVTEIGSSLDLKAGQAVDRVGVMLGLSFPCGKQLEALAEKSDKHYNIKPVVRNGCCSLSGVENKCRKMLSDGEKFEDIAAYCLQYICESIRGMTFFALEERGGLPIIFAGGVMSNRLIGNRLKKEFGAYFAEPEFSCDNAAGTALFAAMKSERN